jgi:antitoxin ParD1/3/4
MPEKSNPLEAVAAKRDRLRAALDEAIERGRAAARAGKVTPAEEVFDRLEAKYRAMIKPRDEGG